jgi:ATP-dependent DNA ligase
MFSEHVEGSAAGFFKAVDGMGLEGIVSKRAGSKYRSGPAGNAWLKVKTYQESEFEVAGVLREPGKPAMALMADRERRYVGSAFIALYQAMRERLWARVQEKAGPPPKGFKARAGAEWLKPGLVGRVKHLKGEEMLRHASLKTLREE